MLQTRTELKMYTVIFGFLKNITFNLLISIIVVMNSFLVMFSEEKMLQFRILRIFIIRHTRHTFSCYKNILYQFPYCNVLNLKTKKVHLSEQGG